MREIWLLRQSLRWLYSADHRPCAKGVIEEIRRSEIGQAGCASVGARREACAPERAPGLAHRDKA